MLYWVCWEGVFCLEYRLRLADTLAANVEILTFSVAVGFLNLNSSVADDKLATDGNLLLEVSFCLDSIGNFHEMIRNGFSVVGLSCAGNRL